jgi:tRNA1Val (adenine37-N6)-methyltransferase
VGNTLDSIKDIRLFQSKKGYRFSVDALLLEHFISMKARPQAVELGTGSGIISLLLAKRFRDAKIYAVELQKPLAECTAKNVELNKLEARVELIHEDIRNLKKVLGSNKFDCVFSNPPFRKVRSGRLSADSERAIARHEIKISLSDIIDTASYLLKNMGRFYLIYHPLRMIELIGLMQKAGLEPKKMRFVHSRVGEEAKMVLIEAVKGSGKWLKIAPPFYIYDKDGGYTAEMKKVYGN